MVRGILVLWLALINGIVMAKTHAMVKQNQAVILYQLQPGEDLKMIGSRFGVSEETLNALNKHRVTDGEFAEIEVPVAQSLLLQCDDSACEQLYYKAEQGESFESIARYFGNLHAAMLKRLNPGISLLSTGDEIMVGYLPLRILQPVVSTIGSKVPEVITNADETELPSISGKDSTQVVVASSANAWAMSGPAGYFGTEWQKTKGIVVTGNAAAFKSLGGWQDGKYYVLTNAAKAGTVVKLVNTANQKAIYAKVLSGLPKVKKDKDLLLRMNNAAAAMLDVWEDVNFEVIMEY